LPWIASVPWHQSIIVARWFTAISGIGVPAISAFGLAAASRVRFPTSPRVRLAAVPQIHFPAISDVRITAILGLGLVTTLGFFKRPPVNTTLRIAFGRMPPFTAIGAEYSHTFGPHFVLLNPAPFGIARRPVATSAIGPLIVLMIVVAALIASS
jgi:hypothetical protein